MPGDAEYIYQQFSGALYDLARGNDRLRDRLIAADKEHLSGVVISAATTGAGVAVPESLANDIELFRAALRHTGGFETMPEDRLQDRVFDICDITHRLGRLLGRRDE